MISGCRQNANLDTFERKAPSRLDRHPGVARGSFLISCVVGPGHLGIFQVRAVIDESSDFDAIDQLRHAANVVAMVVRDEHVVDLCQTGLVSSGEDSISIAAFVARPAGINQQRLSRRTYYQRGLAALYVDEIDLKRHRVRSCSKG